MESELARKDDIVRAEILAAAKTLLQRYGLDKTTMEDIAREAGKGKSTLYYYFKDKEQIMLAVAHHEKAEADLIVREAVDKAASPTEKLRTYFLTSYKVSNEKLFLYSLIYVNDTKFMDLARTIQKESNAADIELMKQIFLSGIKAGEFKSIKECDCEALALVGILLLRGMRADILLAGEQLPKEMRLDMAIDIFIRGIS